MAGEAYADKFNDFNPDGIFRNHSSRPKRFVIITRQIKATEPKKIVTVSRRFSTAAVIASNKGRTPTHMAGPMLLEYPQ